MNRSHKRHLRPRAGSRLLWEGFSAQNGRAVSSLEHQQGLQYNYVQITVSSPSRQLMYFSPSAPLAPTTAISLGLSSRANQASQIPGPIARVTTSTSTSPVGSPTKPTLPLTGPSINIPSYSSLHASSNCEVPTYFPSRYLPSLPLPERWNWQHDRAICMMDARDCSLHKIITSLKSASSTGAWGLKAWGSGTGVKRRHEETVGRRGGMAAARMRVLGAAG